MNRIFSRWGMCGLLVFALLYYGQYYQAGLYPAAEGGVEGMVALRLLEGQRPIVDTFLGYNLLWFYPVVGLFKIFGPSYTVLRLFFFFLSTLTGLMSFRLVRLCTGNSAVAFLAGLLVLLIPGQMFRNYMAFIVVLNMTTFFSAYLLPAGSTTKRLVWMAASGVTLAIAWLIRVDVGFFLSCLWLGMLTTFVIRRENFIEQLRVALLGALLALVCFAAIHLPIYLDASHRGFGSEFLGQYKQWPSMIQTQGGRVIETICKSVSERLPHRKSPALITSVAIPVSLLTPKTPASAVPTAPSVQTHKSDKEIPATLARRSFLAGTPRDKMLAINLYLPLLIAMLIALGSLGTWIYALARQNEELRDKSLIILSALGCSLTLFPQYFFWRPDMVHLSEFMVPMTLTSMLVMWYALHAWKHSGKVVRVGLGIVLFFTALTLVLYYINACQSQSSGGIATGLNKRFEFHAANGVNVKLSQSELQDTSAIYRIITAASGPEEYLICYPYNPEINFMTARPSYEYNFYIDNAMISPERFYKEEIEKIGKFHPAAFVITDWAINSTEQSQFSNWAAQTYGYITGHYKLAYKHGNVELYIRPDRVEAIPKDLRF